MIRNSSKRMTVARLKQRMDRRFDEVDKRFDEVDKRFDALEGRLCARIDSRFESISAKLDSIATNIDEDLRHHTRVIDEHEGRIRDLEASARSAP